MLQALWRVFMVFREFTTFMTGSVSAKRRPEAKGGAGGCQARAASRAEAEPLSGSASALFALAVEGVEAVEAQLAGIEDMDEAGPALGLLDDAAQQMARDAAALQLRRDPAPRRHHMGLVDLAVVLGDAAVEIEAFEQRRELVELHRIRGLPFGLGPFAEGVARRLRPEQVVGEEELAAILQAALQRREEGLLVGDGVEALAREHAVEGALLQLEIVGIEASDRRLLVELGALAAVLPVGREIDIALEPGDPNAEALGQRPRAAAET